MRSGSYITVGRIVLTHWMKQDSGGFLDLPGTLAALRNAASVLDRAVETGTDWQSADKRASPKSGAAVRTSACATSLSGLAGALGHAPRQVIHHLGLVARHFIISALQQLILAVEQRLANALLHARIVQFALSG
jgi:hypothetical protein